MGRTSLREAWARSAVRASTPAPRPPLGPRGGHAWVPISPAPGTPPPPPRVGARPGGRPRPPRLAREEFGLLCGEGPGRPRPPRLARLAPLPPCEADPLRLRPLSVLPHRPPPPDNRWEHHTSHHPFHGNPECRLNLARRRHAGACGPAPPAGVPPEGAASDAQEQPALP